MALTENKLEIARRRIEDVMKLPSGLLCSDAQSDAIVREVMRIPRSLGKSEAVYPPANPMERARQDALNSRSYMWLENLHKGPMIHIELDIDKCTPLDYLRRRFDSWTRDVEIRQ